MTSTRALHIFNLSVALTLAACGTAEPSSEHVHGDPRTSVGAPAAERGAGLPGETYDALAENDFIETAKQPVSTFGVDVDTASYSLMRRDVLQGRLPNQNGVRPEEYVNYFRYSYPQPSGEHPFSVTVDGAPSHFGEGLHLVRIGLQGKVIPAEQRQRANLVFLVDVSGSMSMTNKLPLVQYTLKQLVKRLEPSDTLGIVTYAGSDRVVLEPTPVTNKSMILDAIDSLMAGGGTNGEGGIRKAYELASKAKTQDSINRVVLCTDGDFNVGATGDELVRIIEQARDTGVTLTTLGFGQGNYNDSIMEKLADHGNGNYAFIDGPGEANRVLGEKLVSTLQVIAKDVKVQVEFNPDAAVRYRLIGYENRVMSNEDFRNDQKDSGEIGAGHSVTAFYEVELTEAAKSGSLKDGALAKVRLRYKQPEGDQATELERSLTVGALAPSFEAAPSDLRFAAGVVEFAEILRRSKHSQGARFDDILAIVNATAGDDPDRIELRSLVEKAKGLW